MAGTSSNKLLKVKGTYANHLQNILQFDSQVYFIVFKLNLMIFESE